MSSSIDALAEAVQTARALWPGELLDGAAPGVLAGLNEKLGEARRLLDAAAAAVAAEIARQSRPELGRDGFAKKQGYRTPATLIAATMGTTTGEAVRLLQVGEATAPRVTMTGEPAPARHPHVGEALRAGRVSACAAQAIVGMLDRVALRAGHDSVTEAEQVLVGQAPGLTMDQLAKILARAEAYLDPDGVQPREEELRSGRSLHIREDRSGMVILTAKLDPEHAAPVKVAIEAIVAAEYAAARDAGDAAPPSRSFAMMQADALTLLCAHALECGHRDVPLRGATVVVRVGLEDLTTGRGHGTIDGITAPVSIGTVRRIAAADGILPLVLGGDSEILDLGRARRLFTQKQKLVLIERDGGCAKCGAPPGMTKVHHIRWWSRDTGPTDLANGILLCEGCHHDIHDDGWDISIDGTGTTAHVWFTPPAWLDPTRTPRPGARHRYDYAPAA